MFKKELYTCQICEANWSKGYCSICGKLVCDDCSRMVGYARTCLDCFESVLEGEKKIEKLKKYLKKHEKSTNKSFELLYKASNQRNSENKDYRYLYVGIDDLDSPYGFCTTYLGAILSYLLQKHAEFLDYPRLVRLNPNIPLKTRGNAAIAFLLRIKKEKVKKIKDLVINTMEKSVQSTFPTTQPGAVFFMSNKNKIPPKLETFYYKALRDVLSYNDVKNTIDELPFGSLEIYSDTSTPQGAIGATAAIGAVFPDYTYELLAYRDPSLQRSKREVSKEKLKFIDSLFGEVTFDNIEDDNVLITPHGPDPVVFGLRGDFPIPLLKAFNLLEHEEIERWCLYKTNQATNVHIRDIETFSEAKMYQTVRNTAWVKEEPLWRDGTIVMSLIDGTYDCKAFLYPPTGELRHIAKKLGRGDKIEIVGAVMDISNGKIQLNVEELLPISLLPRVKRSNPFCPRCGSRVKSKGRTEYRCPHCGYRIRSKRKIFLLEEVKELKKRKRYTTPPSAHRHLTLPKERERFALLKKEGKLKTSFVQPFAGKSKPSLDQLRKKKIQIS